MLNLSVIRRGRFSRVRPSGHNDRGSPRRLLRGLCLVIVLAAVLSASSATTFAGSIFDDEWSPPKPVVRKPVEVPAVTPPKSTTEPAPTPPVVGEPAPPAPTAAPEVQTPEAPAAVLPIPSKQDQTRSRALLKAAFAGQLKDRSMPARKKLARVLLDEAPKNNDTPSDQFVLLGGAIDASKDGGDLDTCFQAADQMASRFQVDALNIKSDAALKTNLRGDSPKSASDNVRAALDVVELLAAVEDFQTAQRILSSARSVSSSDAELSKLVQQRIKSVEGLRVSHERAAAALEKLKSAPDDPAANLTVGTFVCFSKGQWEKGLPYLAKGGDAALKKLSADEIAGAKTAEAVAVLADGWWDAAAKLTPAQRAEVMEHAAMLYKSQVNNATGLRKTAMEHRIAEADDARAKVGSDASKSNGHIVHLLRLVDPAKDTIAGKFAIQDGELVNQGQGQQRIEFPYHPPKEYDFRMEFTRMTGGDVVIPLLSREGVPFIWVMQDHAFLFHYLKVGSLFDNRTKVEGPGVLKNNVRYTTVVQVRNNGVKSFINGKLVCDFKTDYSDFNPDIPYWALRDKSALGIGVGTSKTVIHVADLIEISGSGSKKR